MSMYVAPPGTPRPWDDPDRDIIADFAAAVARDADVSVEEAEAAIRKAVRPVQPPVVRVRPETLARMAAAASVRHRPRKMAAIPAAARRRRAVAGDVSAGQAVGPQGFEP